MNAVVALFKKEKALVGAFSVIMNLLSGYYDEPHLDEGHGAADCHAGDVEGGPVLDLVLGLGSDREERWDTTH